MQINSNILLIIINMFPCNTRIKKLRLVNRQFNNTLELYFRKVNKSEPTIPYILPGSIAINVIHINTISSMPFLSNFFIDNFSDRLRWDLISSHCTRTREFSFIERYKHRLDWSILCTSHIYSQEFLDKFSDYVDWGAIAMNLHKLEKFQNDENLRGKIEFGIKAEFRSHSIDTENTIRDPRNFDH